MSAAIMENELSVYNILLINSFSSIRSSFFFKYIFYIKFAVARTILINLSIEYFMIEFLEVVELTLDVTYSSFFKPSRMAWIMLATMKFKVASSFLLNT